MFDEEMVAAQVARMNPEFKAKIFDYLQAAGVPTLNSTGDYYATTYFLCYNALSSSPSREEIHAFFSDLSNYRYQFAAVEQTEETLTLQFFDYPRNQKSFKLEQLNRDFFGSAEQLLYDVHKELMDHRCFVSFPYAKVHNPQEGTVAEVGIDILYATKIIHYNQNLSLSANNTGINMVNNGYERAIIAHGEVVLQ